MFFPGSRSEKAGTYSVRKRDGSTVTVTQRPLPRQGPLLGYHRRLEGICVNLP